MTALVNRDTLRTAYDFLSESPPFNRWNLPDSDDVTFRVVRSKTNYGWHQFDGRRHTIAISSVTVRNTPVLVTTMAHEMIHVHECATCRPRGEHSKAFRKWAAQVCRAHGFEPKEF